MHLVIYTQKRDRPLILRLPFIVRALLVLLLPALPVLTVYLWLENRELQESNRVLLESRERLAGQVLEAGRRVARLEEEARQAGEHPSAPEVLFEALERTFASGQQDTLFPGPGGELRGGPGKAPPQSGPPP
ncbi:MAG: hypothetical protein JXQ83_01390 [Candidatus Glassbacteria bacterium]|nr:hypothetical protein [Candidatus Glassbacteria bacterium]